MYWRNWAQGGSAAPVVHDQPSPPPSTEVGSPWPPGTDGNGNQPSLESMLLSVVSLRTSRGSQSPCSSIATLPFASRPAELVGLLCAATPLNPPSNGFVARNEVRSFVACE